MDGVDRIGKFMTSAPSGFANIDEVADAVAAYQPHRPRPPQTNSLRRNVREGPDGRLYWHWDRAFMRLSETLADPGPHHARLVAAARRIAVPTLLVRGAMSDIVSVEAPRNCSR
jgi:hypothetical protein